MGKRNDSTTAVVAALTAIAILTLTALAAAAAPAPCGGQAQITDATGDGHHNTTDVLSAWFSEASGHLQAVIKVQYGNWAPDHEDSDAAGFALLFGAGGQTRYVRLLARRPPAAPQFDYGTSAAPGSYVSAGTTTGTVSGGPGGTATIDVPPQTGAVAGALLSNPYILTWDGFDGTEPHWVDRAPGGVTPAGTEYGADYVVGLCGADGGGPGGPGAGALSAVQLDAPAKRVGGGRIRVSGAVVPARGGVPVELSVKARRAQTRTLTTRSDGSFSTSLKLSETSSVRAAAGGIRSRTLTVTVFSKTRITVRRPRSGGVLVRGRVSPALPGRVLLLRTTAYEPSARTKARKGRFRFRFKHLARGRYQAVFIPTKDRAERSTSNKGVIR